MAEMIADRWGRRAAVYSGTVITVSGLSLLGNHTFQNIETLTPNFRS